MTRHLSFIVYFGCLTFLNVLLLRYMGLAKLLGIMEFPAIVVLGCVEIFIIAKVISMLRFSRAGRESRKHK